MDSTVPNPREGENNNYSDKKTAVGKHVKGRFGGHYMAAAPPSMEH